MDIARQIWKNKIRINRKTIFEKLDILYLRAIENNNSVEQHNIAILKQKLRDAPSDSRIENAISPSELLIINPLLEINI
jgi:hypothetical protein